ncbi:globin [Phenylobacterium sp.]|jgi:hemoglobin-like flavoprotein|uniref:globin n=1 Tax=Phenylobacterium sp. TaxID=1871053 RepID=UPI002F428376
MADMGEIIAQSLEIVAERAGDPAPQVYARLFAAYPEMEAMFVRDTTGAVRGEMLAMAFQCLLDLDGAYAANMIAAERVNHDAFGVPHEVFGRFFPLLAQTCRELLGEAWTAEMDAAWRAALGRIAELTPI